MRMLLSLLMLLAGCCLYGQDTIGYSICKKTTIDNVSIHKLEGSWYSLDSSYFFDFGLNRENPNYLNIKLIKPSTPILDSSLQFNDQLGFLFANSITESRNNSIKSKNSSYHFTLYLQWMAPIYHFTVLNITDDHLFLKVSRHRPFENEALTRKLTLFKNDI